MPASRHFCDAGDGKVGSRIGLSQEDKNIADKTIKLLYVDHEKLNGMRREILQMIGYEIAKSTEMELAKVDEKKEVNDILERYKNSTFQAAIFDACNIFLD